VESREIISGTFILY